MRRALLALALAATAASACAPADAASPAHRVEIRIRYSAFVPARIVVPAGVPVTVVIRNEDPIDHEWLVGDAAFHARHRDGAETAHADRPDELSVPALATRSTTLTFAPGSTVFICHFPGHESYGMVGVVTTR